jgi:hypothetical protein
MAAGRRGGKGVGGVQSKKISKHDLRRFIPLPAATPPAHKSYVRFPQRLPCDRNRLAREVLQDRAPESRLTSSQPVSSYATDVCQIVTYGTVRGRLPVYVRHARLTACVRVDAFSLREAFCT